jgi:hypothetical protein
VHEKRMASAEVTLDANRSPLSDLAAAEPDLHVVLRFENDPSSPTSALMMDQRTLCEATRSQLYALFSRAMGVPARDWVAVAANIGLNLEFPARYTTLEQNLIKATFLLALWLEPSVVATSHPVSLEHELIDNIIVDYSGAPERQRYIYFPRQDLPAAVTDRLYRLHLLCRAHICVDQRHVTRHFVPLITPGVSPHAFDPGKIDGGPSYRAWQNIRRDMGRCVERTIRS